MEHKNKLGLAGLILLAGCSTLKPTGSIDLAYVPRRTDDKLMQNEMMTELDLGVKYDNFTVGGRSRTFINFDKLEVSDINRQEYDLYANFTKDQFKLYLEHMCSHPIDEKEYWMGPEEDRRYINYDSITKVGVKYSF